jgi:hypothetical protein
VKRVTFALEGQGFAADVSLDGDYEIRTLWLVGTEGQEVQLVKAFWFNITPAFETAIREAAEAAAKERE